MSETHLRKKVSVSHLPDRSDLDRSERQEPIVREVSFCPLPPFYFRRYMGQGEKRAVLSVSTADGREIRKLDSIM